ncbi:MAG: squalene/phytoene synthase family protein, partial [Halobacteriaceae archaeon]
AGEQALLLETYADAVDPNVSTSMAEFRSEVDEWIPARSTRSDDWTVVSRVEVIWATFNEQPDDVRTAIIPPVTEMVRGMAEFIDHQGDEGGIRIADQGELDRYCYIAAGTVGNLITNLLTREGVSHQRSKRLYAHAEEFGLLLQLVNIAKDVHDDYTNENNVYLPAEWLTDVNVDQAEIIDPSNRKPVASVICRTARHANSFLDDAQTYLEKMPLSGGNTLAAWSVPFLLAVGTLRELRARPEDALTEAGVKVSRREVLAVLDAATDIRRDSLGEFRHKIAREPFHLARDFTHD